MLKKLIVLLCLASCQAAFALPPEIRQKFENAVFSYNEKESTNADKIILPYAEKGDEKAQITLAALYSIHFFMPYGVKRDKGDLAQAQKKEDLAKARYWYERAAIPRNPPVLTAVNLGARTQLLEDYLKGINGPKDYHKAKWFWQNKSQWARLTDIAPEAPKDPIDFLFEYDKGVAQSFEEAIALWLPAAKQGDAEAQYIVANLLTGLTRPNAQKEAIFWLKKAANKGHAVSQKTLATWYLAGYNVPKSPRLAKYWMRKAAQAGNAEAQKYLKTHPK